MTQKKYKHIFQSISLILSVALFLSGCSTVQSRKPRSEIVDGKEIPGTETFKIENLNINKDSAGETDIFTMDYDVFRSVKVTQIKKSWTDVERKRYYAISGVDSEYTLASDIGDLSLGAVGIVFICIGPLSALGLAGKEECAAWRSTYINAFIPGVCECGGGINDGSPIVETNRVNEIEKIVSPRVSRKKSGRKCDDFFVHVFSGEKKVLGGKIKDGKFKISIKDLLRMTSERPMVKIVCSSQEIPVLGQNEFSFRYDFANVMDRYRAYEKKYPTSSLSVLSKYSVFVSDKNLGNRRLLAGEKGVVNVFLCAIGEGDCYRVKSSIKSISGELAFENPEGVNFLKAMQPSRIKIPFSLPLKAKDGIAIFEVTAEDALGRKSKPVQFKVPYVHRELPQLQMVDIALNSTGKKNEYNLEVVLRNKGTGDAEKITLKVDGTPSVGSLIASNVSIKKIAPYSRKTVKLQIKIPENTVEKMVKIKFVATERFGVGGVTREVSLPIIRNP